MLKKLQSYIVAALVVTIPLCMEVDGSIEVMGDMIARTAPLATISPCAIGRLEQIRLQGNCSVTDMACLCHAGLAGTDTFRWLLAKCPFPDALASQNLTSSACDIPVRDISLRYTMFLIPTSMITCLIMIARLAESRFFSTRHSFSSDDWITLLALMLAVPGTVVNITGLQKSGLGRDIWTLSLTEISEFAFYLYIMTLVYLFLMMLLKLTFCFLYLRIFQSTTLKRLLWATVVFHVLFGTATFVSSVFTCTPVNYLWTRYTRTAEGHCIDIPGLYWTYGAVTVASDVWLLALPLPSVLKLNLPWQRKIGVTIMLLTGFLATVISIVRLQYVFSFTTSVNATFDGYWIGVWSDLEFNVGMICACLPSLRLLAARFWPSRFKGKEAQASYAVSVIQARGCIILHSA